MKIENIAISHGWKVNELYRFISESGFSVTKKMFGDEVDDADVDSIIAQYSAVLTRKAAEEKAQREAAEVEEQKKQAALASMLITSGFSFDGYKITKYSGYISGDDAVEVARESQGFFGGRVGISAGDGLMAALVIIRRNALNELKEAAYALGCNAVVGVDFDYITLDPQTASNTGGTLYLPYIFGVTANGNAVVIEKNE